jgi:hypothetical protein
MNAATFAITHVITEDGPDGQPWPPDGDFWCVVARSHGFTRWRHIGLQSKQKQSGAVTLDGGLSNSAASQTKRRN